MTTSDRAERAPPGALRLRLFFAAWPPEPAAEALHRWAAATQGAIGGRVIPVSNIHLTLAFLGSVPVERLEQALACGRRVTDRHDAGAILATGETLALRITEARYWPRSRIVWVGPKKTPEALVKLAAELERSLAEAGFELDSRGFVAHVTLLRDVPRLRGLPELPDIEWPVTEFVLVRSETAAAGSVYTILERFPLGYT